MEIVILGASGRLGAALMREYREKYDIAGFNHAQLDLANLDDVRRKLGAMNFDVRINAEAPEVLAEICTEKEAKLIHFSTDYVFDGDKRAPYIEGDQANPISAYGESKLAGEKNVLAADGRHLVVRVSWVFGPDRPSFIDAMIKRAQQDEKIDAIADKFSTPTYTHDVAHMLPQFFDRGIAGGILHFANAGKCTWQEYGQWALNCCREAGVPLKARTVGALRLSDMTRPRQCSGGQAPWVARRPVYSVLSAAKYAELTGTSPRTWRDAVADYIRRFYSKK